MKNLFKISLSFLFLLASLSQVYSQKESAKVFVPSTEKDAVSVVTTISEVSNRLGRTRSSRAIPKGRLLTNVNFSHLDLTIGSFEVNRNGPITSVGYGLTKRMDISLSSGYYFNSGSSDAYWWMSNEWNQWQGLKFSSKFNLLEQKGWMPQMAIAIDFKGEYITSFGPSLDRFNNGSGIILSLPWSYHLGEKFRLGGGFGYMVSNSYRDMDHLFNCSINSRYEFSIGLGVFMDVFVPTDFYYSSVTGTIGAYYRINPSIQVDFSFERIHENLTLYNTYDRSQLSCGFSWLMFNK